MPTLFGKEFGLSAAKTISAGALAAVMAFTPAAAQEATPTSAEPSTAAHIQADIVISYGSDINENMADIVEVLSRQGINAVAIPDLDSPNCAALILNGEEMFRYSEESVRNAQIVTTAVRLVNDERISRRAASDCPAPVDVASLVPNN